LPLVGDAIIAARQAVPDMPQTLPQTVASAVVIASGGSTLPTGTYAVVVTQRNQWGETLPSTEITGLAVTLGVNGIQVTSLLQPSATTVRAYLTLPGGAPGTEQQFVESTGSTFVISAPPTNAGVPPVLNKAWLPDTDGPLISTTAIYGWINDGLAIISNEAGGLLDYGGVQSIVNQPLYLMPGQWRELSSVWYDGYLMLGGDRGQFFRRNAVTSAVLSSAQVSTYNNQQLLEVYPQPARSGSFTFLNANMLATDTTATLLNAFGFLLPFGFVKIDSEIMAYGAINGNVLSGLQRGLGGTSPAVPHNLNAPAVELNIFWSGKRQYVSTYVPGNSASVLPIPSGWEVLLFHYVAGRAKIVEHDSQTLNAFIQEMRQGIKEWARANRGVVRRRQVGDLSGPLVYGPTPAGGLIIK
jgi:hypothetical protein